jgi:hypothetical protein
MPCVVDADGLSADFLLEEGREIPVVIARGGDGGRHGD